MDDRQHRRGEAARPGVQARPRARTERGDAVADRRVRQLAPPEPSPAELFARAVGPVHPIRERRLADVQRPRPAPHPFQRERDERDAVRASMSDEVTLESLLLTDDALSYRRPGLGADVVRRLRRGHFALQAQVDLHGLNREQARDRLSDFVRDAHRRGMRCVRVVHGKGRGSPGGRPVLKDKVQRWLAQHAEVIAFAQATGPQGGAGALMVLLAG